MIYGCGILLGGASGKEPACQCRRCKRCKNPGSIRGLGRSPRGGHGNPLQYSCLENPMDRGAWQAIRSHRVRQTRLKQLSMHIKRNVLLIHAATWMNLQRIILNGKDQAVCKRLYAVWVHLYKVLEMKKKNENEGQIHGCQRLRKGWGWEGSGYGYERTSWGYPGGDRSVAYNCLPYLSGIGPNTPQEMPETVDNT